MPNPFLGGRSWFELAVPIPTSDRPATLSIPWKGSFASDGPAIDLVVGLQVNSVNSLCPDPAFFPATPEFTLDQSTKDTHCNHVHTQIEPAPGAVEEPVMHKYTYFGCSIAQHPDPFYSDLPAFRGSSQPPRSLQHSSGILRAQAVRGAPKEHMGRRVLDKPPEDGALPGDEIQSTSSVSTASFSVVSMRTRSSGSRRARHEVGPYHHLKDRKVYNTNATTYWYPSHGSTPLNNPPPVPEDIFIPVGHLFLHYSTGNHQSVTQAWVRDAVAAKDLFWRPISHGDAFDVPGAGRMALSISTLGTPAWATFATIKDSRRRRKCGQSKRPV